MVKKLLLVICVLAMLTLHHNGSALHPADLRTDFRDWRLFAAFGTICYSLVGLDLASIMGDEIRDPRRASELWASIDRQLTNAAEWVPTVASREVELTSDRLRNYEYNPVWGFLADQAWVR